MTVKTITMTVPPNGGGLYQGMPSGTIYNLAAGNNFQAQPTDVGAFALLGFSIPNITTGNIGTVPAGVTATEYGDAYNHTSVLTLNTTLGAIAGGASLGLGILIYTLPVGDVLVTNSQMKVGITQTAGNINADTPTVGIGTVVASGAVAVLSGTATFQNVQVGKAAANCTGTPTDQTANCTSSPFALVIAAAAVHTLYFNAAFAWAASGDPAALVTGSVIINWKFFG